MTPEDQRALEDQAVEMALKEALARAEALSFVLAIGLVLYGFTSLGFIQKFNPTVTLWGNIWPRVLFSFMPLFGAGFYLRRAQLSNRTKLLIWIAAFSSILHATAWIRIWPIALWHSPEIMTYVHAANVYILALVYTIVAPPSRYLAAFTGIFFSLFLLPLFYVAHLTGDKVIFNTIVNEMGMSLVFNSIGSMMIDRLRTQIATMKIRNEVEASKFLGPVLSKAIFHDKREHLRAARCKGFIVSIDVRDSTNLQQLHREDWLKFRQQYFSLVSQLVSRHGGYIQKTVGDCHVINFGVMDYGVDLSELPGIGNELRNADERRLQRASNQTFAFVDDLFNKLEDLSRKYFPAKSVSVGAGIDKGWVDRGVQGDSVHSLELDVNGDPVNCSNRLQDYSKLILNQFNWNSSVMVVSPFASDYLPDLSPFVKVQTIDKPVRNYPGIKWVLVRRHMSDATKEIKRAA